MCYASGLAFRPEDPGDDADSARLIVGDMYPDAYSLDLSPSFLLRGRKPPKAQPR